ncbi:MAG: hypothetical protein LBI42_13360 [Chitinispirillales bacterium]|jgi:hypothetical protein|nr:hypothetical protein [Chitinispirillales bacterium]
MAFLAINGAISIFGKKSSLNIFRGRVFILAFCVASLSAFVLETTYFNFQYYLKYFASGEFHTLEASPQDSTSKVILTSDGTLAEMIFKKNDSTALDSSLFSTSDSTLDGTSINKKDSATILGGIVFKDINRKVYSIFVEPVFDSSESIVMNLSYIDELGTNFYHLVLYKGLPRTHHISIQPCGNISELTIGFPDIHPGMAPIPVSQIAVNKQVPFYFSGLRLFVVSCLIFAVILLLNKKLREKTAYLLFEYKFDPANKKQNLVYTFSAGLLILFSFICAYTSVTENEPQAQQYNKYLVDALIAGRAHLEAGNPEKMLNAQRPYDLRWLDENGYERSVDWFGDWVYYKGKFYSYFGVVPALMLYVPYKMITGNYLSNHGGIFLFVAFSVVLMARLWRFLVKKYMPGTNFVFHLLSFFTLFFASGLFAPLRFTRFYSIVSAAGFMFVIAGILLLFESVKREKPDRSKLFFASMCLALAVGCRPNLLFVSLLVPVFLWKYRLWKQLPLIIIPYVMVAIPMGLYNLARFDSFFDFGVKYNMTNLNVGAHSLLDPIGKAINTFAVSVSYLFTMNSYSFFFPYVECIPQHHKLTLSALRFYDKGCGIINFPIVLCLFYFIKNIFRKQTRPKTFYISSAFLSVAAVLILLNSYLIGHSGRYTIDFAIFIIFPSLFCAYYWCNDGQACQYKQRLRQKTVYVFLTFSIFVGLFLFATSVTNDATPGSPQFYYYLQNSLSFIR